MASRWQQRCQAAGVCRPPIPSRSSGSSIGPTSLATPRLSPRRRAPGTEAAAGTPGMTSPMHAPYPGQVAQAPAATGSSLVATCTGRRSCTASSRTSTAAGASASCRTTRCIEPTVATPSRTVRSSLAWRWAMPFVSRWKRSRRAKQGVLAFRPFGPPPWQLLERTPALRRGPPIHPTPPQCLGARCPQLRGRGPRVRQRRPELRRQLPLRQALLPAEVAMWRSRPRRGGRLVSSSWRPGHWLVQ